MWDITYGVHAVRLEARGTKSFKAVNCVDDDFLMAKLKKRGYIIKYIGDRRFQNFCKASWVHLCDTNTYYEFAFMQLDKWEKENFEKPFFVFSYDIDGGHDPWGALKRDCKADMVTYAEELKRFTKAMARLKRGGEEQKEMLQNNKLALRTNWIRHNPELFSTSRLFEMLGAQARQYDEKLGKFFEWFVDSGLYKDTALYFFSDHGESLTEQPGICGHAISLYDGEVKIPLFIYDPKLACKGLCEVTDNVSIVDIMPTILNVETIADGVNLFKRKQERFVFFEFTRYAKEEGVELEWKTLPSPNDFIRGVKFGDYKFIYTRDLTGKIVTELYKLSIGALESEDTKIVDSKLEELLLNKLIGVFNMDTENLKHVGRLEEVLEMYSSRKK